MRADDLALWVPLFFTALGIAATLITTLTNAAKTRTETEILKANQAELHEGQQRVLSQFDNDHGNSMRDKVDSIEKTVNRTSSDLAGIHRDIGRLANVDLVDRENAAKEHERIYQSIDETSKNLLRHIEAVPETIKKAQAEAITMLEERMKNEA